MQQAFDGGGLGRNIQRATNDADASLLALVKTPGAEALPDLPVRVIRRGRNHPHLMALSGQPGSHLTAVFTDASQLRAVVDAVEQNFHQCVRACCTLVTYQS